MSPGLPCTASSNARPLLSNLHRGQRQTGLILQTMQAVLLQQSFQVERRVLSTLQDPRESDWDLYPAERNATTKHNQGSGFRVPSPIRGGGGGVGGGEDTSQEVKQFCCCLPLSLKPSSPSQFLCPIQKETKKERRWGVRKRKRRRERRREETARNGGFVVLAPNPSDNPRVIFKN